MAYIVCLFFIPRDSALLIQSRKTVKRFLKLVELTDEELAAAQDDHDKPKEATRSTKKVRPLLVTPTAAILTHFHLLLWLVETFCFNTLYLILFYI